MARKLFVRFLVCVCLALALSSDNTHVELQQGKTGIVHNPRMADKTFNINDIDSAYWHRGLPDNKKFLISNFGGKITWGSGLPIGKYDLTANFSLVIHNVSYSDGGPYVWQLIPKASGLLTAVVNITIVAPPERMEDVTPTSQPDALQQNIVVIIIAILVVVAMVVVLGVCMYKKRNESSCLERWTHNGDHEAIPMDDVDSVRDTLAKELKVLYKAKMKNTSIHPLDSRTRTTKDIYIFPAMFKRSHKISKAETPTKQKGSQSQYLDDQKGKPVKSLNDLKKLLIKNDHVAVIGSAGCGKTALMGKIGYDWAWDKNFTTFKYVVVLQMKEIRGAVGVLEAIHKLLPADSDITKQQLGDQIKEHKEKVLMIVDGSFLLQSSEDMNRPASEGDSSLKDVLSFNALRGCSLLITISSHQLDKLQNLHSFTVVETTGFSRKNIKQYINKFFEGSVGGKKLIKKVESSTIIETLAKSPIMLQVLCLIWEHENSLPRQIANLYDRAVNVLAKHISHDGSDQPDVNKIDGFKTSIGKVAHGGLDPKEKRSDFSPGEFPDESLQFGLSIGVMSQETYTKVEEQKCVVKFLHLYQEYFAACFLVQGNVREQLLPQVTCETVQKLETLIRFCCGMNDHADESLITNHLRGLKDGLKTHDDDDDDNVACLQRLIEDPSGY